MTNNNQLPLYYTLQTRNAQALNPRQCIAFGRAAGRVGDTRYRTFTDRPRNEIMPLRGRAHRSLFASCS